MQVKDVNEAHFLTSSQFYVISKENACSCPFQPILFKKNAFFYIFRQFLVVFHPKNANTGSKCAFPVKFISPRLYYTQNTSCFIGFFIFFHWFLAGIRIPSNLAISGILGSSMGPPSPLHGRLPKDMFYLVYPSIIIT